MFGAKLESPQPFLPSLFLPASRVPRAWTSREVEKWTRRDIIISAQRHVSLRNRERGQPARLREQRASISMASFHLAARLRAVPKEAHQADPIPDDLARGHLIAIHKSA